MKIFNKQIVRTRFAPSPTGYLHIGSARTALFNYLFARKNRGVFILRIEDTDKERSKPEFEKDIIESLKWLGIEWEEFYKQSERIKIYKKYLEKLLKEKKAYHCFCEPEELEAKKQEQMSRGEPPHYNGKCANLSEEEVKKNLEKGKKSVIRLKMPAKKIEINDIVRGKIEFDAGLIGDIVIAKDIENPLYNFSVVIDDYEMKITHILRGDDLLSNTPKQIVLQEALDIPKPQYCHLPMILASDKTKLSKRHGAISVQEYKEQGYLPEAITNMIAFMGWNPDSNKEIYSMQELIKDFSLEKIQKSGAIFNVEKLDYLNGFYIRRKTIDRLTKLCLPYLVKAGLITPIFGEQERFQEFIECFEKEIIEKDFIVQNTKEKISFEYLKKIVHLYRERLKKLSEIPELTDFFFKEKLQYNKELLKWRGMENREVLKSLDRLIDILSKIEKTKWSQKNLENTLLKEAEKEKDKGYLLWPLRVAISGKEHSAGPFEIAAILGKEKTLNRLKEAKAIIS